MSDEVKCKDCGSEAELKVTKNNQGYYVCPTCPGTGAYKNKFLTFAKEAKKYMEGEKASGKRKASSSKENPKVKAQKVERDEHLHAKVDKILQMLEKQLKEKEPQSEEETEDETSE